MPGAGYDNQSCQIVQLHDDISEVESQVINLYLELTYEIFEGFGGAVTEAAAYRTPEDKIVVIFLNKSDRALPVNFRNP